MAKGWLNNMLKVLLVLAVVGLVVLAGMQTVGV